MGDKLEDAIATIDRELLGQNLAVERRPSLAHEVETLNAKVRSLSDADLDLFDDPAFFLAVLRQTAWRPPS